MTSLRFLSALRSVCHADAQRGWLVPLLLVVLIASLGAPVAMADIPAASYRPGGLLVRMREQIATREVVAGNPGVSIEATLGQGWHSLRVPRGQEQRLLTVLARHPAVQHAQLDHVVRAQVTPNDARYAEQWNMQQIGMPQAWELATNAISVTVAVLDTGITTDHPDLQSQLWRNTNEVPNNGLDDDGNGYVDDLHGWHFYHSYSGGNATARDDASITDSNGHGTHVAGIVAAAGNNMIGVAGVAWHARLMTVRVLEDDAVGWESDVMRGLNYAVDNGAQIVLMSLGQAESSPALAEAVAQAEARGVLLVAAAGNTGATVLYPAAYPTVLSVGASDQSGARASFSAFGPRLDLIAPGVDILSTWNGVPYFVRSGTSMAAPHVAGAAAVVLASFPTLSAAQLRQCVLHSATDEGAPERDDATGWGLLNVARPLYQECSPNTFLPLIVAP